MRILILLTIGVSLLVFLSVFFIYRQGEALAELLGFAKSIVKKLENE